MRYFLAIEPDAQTKLKIEHWRDKYLPPFSAPVPAGNFHITLTFLGQVTENQLERLSEKISQQKLPRQFELTLNTQGYFAKPKAFWLGSEQIPDALIKLTGITGQAARFAKINIQERRYIPHLTLARKCKTEPPQALLAPEFTTKITEMGLYESISTQNGVRYPKRFSWKLAPGFSHRG